MPVYCNLFIQVVCIILYHNVDDASYNVQSCEHSEEQWMMCSSVILGPVQKSLLRLL